MVTVRLRYVYQDVDRHGNVRHYFWRKGSRKVRIRDALGTDDFFATYRRLLAEPDDGTTATENQTRHRVLRETFRWLCLEYFGSVAFGTLDSRTQRVRRRILETTFDEPIAPGDSVTFADFPISRMTSKAVRVLRDRRVEKPEAANARIKAIRQVFAWGIEHEHVLANPARDVPYLRGKPGGFHSWTIEEVEKFEAHHAVGSRARLALALLLYLGQRRSDIVRLGKQHVRAGALVFTQVKGRNRAPKRLELPILPELQQIINSTPTGDLSFLITQFGRPYTANGFGGWFRRRCDEAGLPHCSAHGLRKAGAAIAAENGATESQLMAIFGWDTMKEAARYTRAARQAKLARDAMPLLMRTKK
jgi:integrase